MPHAFDELDVEVTQYPFTELELDALHNFPATASAALVKTLRGAVMIFQNLGAELWNRGLRLRIVEKKLKSPSSQYLKRCNPEMLMLLDSRFKGFVDPELVMARPLNEWEELRWEKWGNLYLPVIFSSGMGEPIPNY